MNALSIRQTMTLPLRTSRMPLARPSRAVVRSCSHSTSKTKVEPASEFKLHSVAVPALTLANAVGLQKLLQPTADTFASLNLPEVLIRWGHPGNMAVVLLAMGGYGAAYLGWAIRTSDNDELVIKAKDLHPKLAIGMTIFFALGATGGLLSLTMQGKPIFESPHVWTGLTGLTLLALQGMLSLFFEDDPSARTAHAYLGSFILALFVVHAGLGLNLGLSL